VLDSYLLISKTRTIYPRRPTSQAGGTNTVNVPTEAELRADTIEATTTAITNNEKALNSFLKLPVAGYRAHDDHRVNGIGAARL
jgi:hypothetical protein